MCRGLPRCSPVCEECDGFCPLRYWWYSQFAAIVNSAARHIPASVRCAQGEGLRGHGSVLALVNAVGVRSSSSAGELQLVSMLSVFGFSVECSFTSVDIS